MNDASLKASNMGFHMITTFVDKFEIYNKDIYCLIDIQFSNKSKKKNIFERMRAKDCPQTNINVLSNINVL